MGYAVLHMEKTSGTDSAMSAHIERTIKPKNADESRTHLNREQSSEGYPYLAYRNTRGYGTHHQRGQT